MRQRTLALLALLAGLALAACGSGQDPTLEAPSDGEATTTTSAPAQEAPPATGAPLATFEVSLTGDAEVPGPGDDDGSGFATVFVEPEQLCYDLNVLDIAPATAAHIHEGAVGASGPPVITLQAPGEEGAVDGCVPAEAELLQRIADNPGGFYVNVHNDEFPEGALRAQLG